MFYNERQRHELFVGIFRKDAWTCSQLRDYFHRLIPQSVIHHCQITPSYSATHPDSCFAILTFDSISSVDQCLQKRNEIRNEIHLLVKRNLADTPKYQRPISTNVSIHIERFDEQFNSNNLLSYFQMYGAIRQWKIVDPGRTFLVEFEDYDSVDRIFLDNPHYLNCQLISIEKHYPVHVDNSDRNFLRQKFTDLKMSISRFNDFYQIQLMKNQKFIEQNFVRTETHLSDIIASYIHLKQNLDLLHRTNVQLRNNIKQRIFQNRNILQEYDNQLQLQRFLNDSLKQIISQEFS